MPLQESNCQGDRLLTPGEKQAFAVAWSAGWKTGLVGCRLAGIYCVSGQLSTYHRRMEIRSTAQISAAVARSHTNDLAHLVKLMQLVPELLIFDESCEVPDIVARLAQVKPAVFLVDSGRSKVSVEKLVAGAKQVSPATGTILLVSVDEKGKLEPSQANVDGVLSLAASAIDFRAALKAVSEGGQWWQALAPTYPRQMGQERLPEDPSNPSLPSLTRKQMEVLQLVAEGLTNQEIARQLVVSTLTVKAHVKDVMQKLDANNRVHAAIKAVRLGWV